MLRIPNAKLPKTRLIVVLSLLALLTVSLAVVQAQQVYPGGGTAVITDDKALSDKITITMTEVASPGEDKAYEGWLVSDDGGTKTRLGIIRVDDEGVVDKTYTSPSGENLIHLYDKVVITIEPVPDPDPGPSDEVAFKAQVPSGAMEHIRHLLTNWPAGADRGILTNLKLQLGVAITHANLAQDSTTLASVKQHLEHVVNAIEGENGPNYGDLDGDGETEDFGDGAGVLAHAADRSHAGLASAEAPDDDTIALHAGHVLDSGKNAEVWATSARDQALVALKQTDISNTKLLLIGIIQNLTIALDGLDADGDGTIEPIIGEGGTKTAYEHAQLMATYILKAQPVVIPPPDTGGFAPTPLMGILAVILGLSLVLGGGLLVRKRARA